MPVVGYILISLLPLLVAFVAYLWYLTPDPKDLAEEVLRHRKPLNPSQLHFSTHPPPNMTHINCLS